VALGAVLIACVALPTGPQQQACKACDYLLSSGPADWVLVVLGWFGILGALYTLREVQAQSKAGADSAKAALTTARTEMMGGRAYLVFTDWKVRGYLNAGQPINISLTVKNVGNTPAILMSRSGRINIGDSFVPSVTWSDKPSGKAHVLAPQAELTHDIPTQGVKKFEMLLGEDVYPAMIENKLFLYGFSKIIYRDVFDETHFIQESARCIYDRSAGKWVFPSDQRTTETDDGQPRQQQS
jgi:hypothetical protein